MRGTAVGSDYIVGERIGQGGMGAVWWAEQRSTGRRVALKTIPAEQLTDRRLARFEREAAALGRLSHPNIVTLLSTATSDDGGLVLAMELVDGRNLADLLREGGPMAPARVVDVLAQVAEALAYAHERGVVHRDIKPSNVMVTRTVDREHVKVLDFGLAKLLDEGAATASTASGRVLGSAPYMAPEQWTEARDIDGRADLYSLGCTGFELATAQLPHQADSMVGFMRAHLGAAPADPVALRPELADHPGLVGVLRRCLARDRVARYPTAAALLADLRALQRGQAVTGPTTAAAGTASWVSGLAPGWDRSTDTGPATPARRARLTARHGLLIGAGLAALAAAALLLLPPDPDPGAGPGHTPETPHTLATLAPDPPRVATAASPRLAPPASSAPPLASGTAPTTPAPALAPPAEEPRSFAPDSAAPDAIAPSRPVAPPAPPPDPLEVTGDADAAARPAPSELAADGVAARAITLDTVPSGARVFDGRDLLGTTPLALALAPDRPRALLVRRAGHRSRAVSLRWADVADGERVRVPLVAHAPPASPAPQPVTDAAVEPAPRLDLDRLEIR